MAHSIFEKRPKKKYTFADYYRLNCTPDEVAAEFGYTVSNEALNLPTGVALEEKALAYLHDIYQTALARVGLTSETAKREMFIAPLLLAVIKQADAKLRIEYELEVNDKLSGYLDYLLRAGQEIVIVEAKKGDLEKGFNQLIAELVALDIYEQDNSITAIYGVVTFGDVWRFVILNRAAKRILRDTHTYSLPSDTAQLASILVGMLQPTSVMPG